MMGLHIDTIGPLPFLTDEDRREADTYPCCYGSANAGADGCTCWSPVFDLEQQPLQTDLEPETRMACCHDCAYRTDSPEKAEGHELPATVREVFWCHQGIRRAIAYRHADGRERPAPDSRDYRPPIAALSDATARITLKAVPFRADGTPAARCGGWAKTVRIQTRGAA